MRVGVIGLGLLGLAAAERLRETGFHVAGFDVDAGRMEAAAAAGVETAPTGAAAAAAAPVLLTCLPDGPAVSTALFRQGIAAACPRGGIVADLTTCSPAEARAAAALLRARSVRMLDAPVSGSSAVVRAGEALVTVGGSESALEACAPVLSALGRVRRAGPNGAGAAAKLVGNLVLGLNRLALAEGLALAEAAGLDPAAALEILREGAAYSRAMDAKGERMISGRYAPDARLRQHLKDVDLILEMGREADLELPVSALHRRLLAAAAELGYGESDNAAVIEVLRPAGARRPPAGATGDEQERA